VVEISEGVFGNMNCILPMAIIVPDILYTLSLGMVMHLMDWVTFFLKQHCRINKFIQHWELMPPCPSFTGFKKPYHQIMQSSRKEMKVLK